MNFNEDKWDLLMSRRLDGVAGDDEVLELDRELIRNPELRVRWDEFRRVDETAFAALSEIAAEGVDIGLTARRIVDRAVSVQTPVRNWRTRAHRGWLLIPGAIAAALAALMVPRMDWGRSEFDTPGVVHTPHPSRSVSSLPSSLPSTFPSSDPPLDPKSMRPIGINPDLMRTVGTTRRSTGRDVLGIMGDDGNLYFIEVDRSRTIRLPGAGTTSNELLRM